MSAGEHAEIDRLSREIETRRAFLARRQRRTNDGTKVLDGIAIDSLILDDPLLVTERLLSYRYLTKNPASLEAEIAIFRLMTALVELGLFGGRSKANGRNNDSVIGKDDGVAGKEKHNNVLGDHADEHDYVYCPRFFEHLPEPMDVSNNLHTAVRDFFLALKSKASIRLEDCSFAQGPVRTLLQESPFDNTESSFRNNSTLMRRGNAHIIPNAASLQPSCSPHHWGSLSVARTVGSVKGLVAPTGQLSAHATNGGVRGRQEWGGR